MNNFKDIERFLNNKMNASEADLFKKRLEENSDLALEVELQRSENNALENIAFDLLKEEIIALDDTEPKVVDNNAHYPIIKKRYLLIFCIISFLLVLALILYRQNTSPKKQMDDNSKQVIKEQQLEKTSPEGTNKPLKDTPSSNENLKIEKRSIQEKKENGASKKPEYPLIALNEYNTTFKKAELRGEEEYIKATPKWKEIIINFNAKKYKKTILLVNDLSEEDLYILDAQHIKAKSLFLSSQFEPASKLYLSLIQNGDPFQIHNYEYELLLSYLARLDNNKVVFKNLLQKISNDSSHSFQNAAQKLSLNLTKQGYQF